MPSTKTALTVTTGRFDAALALSEAPERLIKFLEVYEDIRGDKLVPSRSDLDLRRLTSLLPEITLMERVAPGNIIYRLMGTSVAERLGTDLTGQNFLDYLDQTERERIELGMSIITEWPCGTFTVYENQYSSGICSRAETLALPLDGGTGKPPYLVVGLHSSQTPETYNMAQDSSVIGSQWRNGLIIDLGNGLPDQSVLDKLMVKNDGSQ